MSKHTPHGTNLEAPLISHGASHGPAYYVKIWAILLLLLIVSICGPMIGIRAITLITAFGIAVVKAVMVASEFMHLKYEKKYVTLMLITMLLFMGIFFFGVAPDVMTPKGQNWIRQPIQVPAYETHEHESGVKEHNP